VTPTEYDGQFLAKWSCWFDSYGGGVIERELLRSMVGNY